MIKNRGSKNCSTAASTSFMEKKLKKCLILKEGAGLPWQRPQPLCYMKDKERRLCFEGAKTAVQRPQPQ